MRNVIIVIMLLISSVGFTCDNCNIYLNLSPDDYKNSIGFYARQRLMYGEYSPFGEMIATRHANHGNDIALWGKEVFETYQTYELRGSFYFKRKWKTTFILPAVNNTQNVAGIERFQVNGFGDPIIIESFQLYTTEKDTCDQFFFQRLNIGIGFKTPLGKINLQYENGTPNLDLQPGTGSWDLISFLSYTLKWKTIGVESNVSFKVNGKNQTNYQYGNTLNGTVNLFADKKGKALTTRFFTTAYIENAFLDKTHDLSTDIAFEHNNTGGNALFAGGGIKFFWNNFILFGEYQKTIYNNLNGFTQLINRNRVNLGLAYNF